MVSDNSKQFRWLVIPCNSDFVLGIESWTGILLRICWNLLVAYFGFYCFSAGIKRELNAARKKVGGFNRICNFFVL